MLRIGRGGGELPMAEQPAFVIDHGAIVGVLCLWVSTPPMTVTSAIRVVMLETLLPYWVFELMRASRPGDRSVTGLLVQAPIRSDPSAWRTLRCCARPSRQIERRTPWSDFGQGQAGPNAAPP